MIGKRTFDLASAALGLVVLGPFMLLVALLVRLTSAGPALYRAPRVGRAGISFDMLKFRTMVATAACDGPAVTVRDDPRVTRAGRFMRRIHLDELPQLINIVRGEMSMVGPRPEAPVYVASYRTEDLLVLSVRPGITGLAQLYFRDEAQWLDPGCPDRYVTAILPSKLAIDRYYVQRRSFGLDFAILIDTVLALLTHRPFLTRQLIAAMVDGPVAGPTVHPPRRDTHSHQGGTVHGRH